MAKGRSVFVEVRVADLFIEEARAEGIIKVKELIPHLLKDAVYTLSCSVARGVHLCEELSAEKADCIDEFEILILLANAFNIVLFLFCKSSSIFFFLSLTLIGKFFFFLFQLILSVLQESNESECIQKINSNDEPNGMFLPSEDHHT